MQVQQTEQSVKACVVLGDLMAGHLIDRLSRLQYVIVFSVLRHESQVLVVIILKEILTDDIDLRETALSIELYEVFMLEVSILVHVVFL